MDKNTKKKTALFDNHIKVGGKMVPYAGYLLPVQYESGVIAEHMAVRQNCGLFDVTHMGELVFSGVDALANINWLLTNDYSNMAVGKVRYGLLCNEAGGIIDDLLVYKLACDKYKVVVNATNRFKDLAWIRKNIFGDVQLEDISEQISQIAIQGPKSREIMESVCSDLPAKYYNLIENVRIGGKTALISKTGYTGENGYEIYLANADAPPVWELLLAQGADEGLIPCGLGARDTLRLEAAMPLYGHEMDESINPLETGLDYGVNLDTDFIGRAAILAQGKPERERIGIQIIGRGIVREHQNIYLADKLIGHSTSGTHCPYLGGAYAMAIVEADMVRIGDTVTADVRGRRIEAKIVELPFYSRKK